MSNNYVTYDNSVEDGEEKLAYLIKKAGQEARERRRKTLQEHFDKLESIAERKYNTELWDNSPVEPK